ncbi:hypothetical protein U472_10485 [Orenia metallireducens]|uniref:Protein kinase domain-containing protein n=1 Tax=Orenia metallireducens TaxID=1413210 RepID=A0A1C0A875_9FIRM|nr:hypothetical protein [Orenia metallireducens]OCL26420.1 hypothetical protein U472_10485 [Orenia metallireducens]
METKRLKNYEIKTKPIGRGQFAYVCWGRDLNQQREVAIKSSSHFNTSKKEATVMESYGSHPFLPEFYDFL